MTGFGASALAGELYEHFGITAGAIAEKVRSLLWAGPNQPPITNRLALFLGTLIEAGIMLDLWFGRGASIFLAKKALALMNWVLFWR